MILILILAPQPLAPGGTCPHLPSPSYATDLMLRFSSLLSRISIVSDRMEI